MEQRETSKGSKLASILRALGAVVLLASAATFLLQQWAGMSYLPKYYSFLALTIVFGVSGLFTGVYLKEEKGARTFFAVLAAVVPVHFAQLGAFIYSRLGELPIHSSALFQWIAPSTLSAFLTTALGISALLPLTFLAFSILARSSAGNLTKLYFAVNGALLLPTRSPVFISSLGIILFAFLLFNDQRLSSVLKTKEGSLVRAMLFTPVFILFARNLHFYEMQTVVESSVLFALSLFFFVKAPRKASENILTTPMFFSSALLGMGGWLNLAGDIVGQSSFFIEQAPVVLTLPVAALLFGMTKLRDDAPKSFLTASAGFLITGPTALLLLQPSLLVSLEGIVAGITCISYGASEKRKGIFAVGLFGFAAGLCYILSYAKDLYLYSPWLSLAVIGIATVLSSSLIERGYTRVLGIFKA